jgi:hypothetical protein
MDAQEFVNSLRNSDRLIRLAHYTNEICDGHGRAIIVDRENKIAVMVESCNEDATKVTRGAIVRFEQHPEAEPRIVGEPAYVSPIIVGQVKLGKEP